MNFNTEANMQNIINSVEKYRKLILDAERYIWANPETGYREVKTTAYLAEKYRELGYELTMAEGITGFYTVIDTGRPGPTVMILGELDSVICATHPEADPETGAVHSCGHHAQSATLLGIAAALTEPHMLDGLSGKIKLCAVPAEELLEIEYRTELKKQGKIKYYGGKSEFMSRGYFADVDVAFMVHTGRGFFAKSGMIGCIAKTITYKGKAAHAGGSPQNGINALYAASCGLNAVNAIRETFTEPEMIRFHPIITQGGAVVNAIPDTAKIETFVRGSSYDAIMKENKKINRALVGAALSLGANVEIADVPGYSPVIQDTNMLEVAKEAYDTMFEGEHFYVSPEISTGCSDIGDLSMVMPIVHPYCLGASGTSHGSDYYVNDVESACIKNAKWQLNMLRLLLQNGGERAKKIKAEYKPTFPSQKAYLEYVDKINSEGNRITYNEDGTATAFIS